MLEFNHLLKNYQEGKTLPQDFYTNSNIFSEEMKRIYFKQWLMVDHISRIPNPGDYFVFDAEKESIIVIRGRDNEVRAFYNVCTHRGSRICLDEEGSKKLLVCPYHAWSFSAEGELKAARFMPEDFKKEEWGLRECHLKIYEGLVFINLSLDEPMNFDEFIEPLKEMMEFHQTSKSKIAIRKKYPTHANFKLVLENFQECYHCPTAHPELCAVQDKDWVVAMGAGIGTAPQKETDEYLNKIKPWVEECKKNGTPSEVYLETDEGLKYTVESSSTYNIFKSTISALIPAIGILGSTSFVHQFRYAKHGDGGLRFLSLPIDPLFIHRCSLFLTWLIYLFLSISFP